MYLRSKCRLHSFGLSTTVLLMALVGCRAEPDDPAKDATAPSALENGLWTLTIRSGRPGDPNGGPEMFHLVTLETKISNNSPKTTKVEIIASRAEEQSTSSGSSPSLPTIVGEITVNKPTSSRGDATLRISVRRDRQEPDGSRRRELCRTDEEPDRGHRRKLEPHEEVTAADLEGDFCSREPSA